MGYHMKYPVFFQGDRVGLAWVGDYGEILITIDSNMITSDQVNLLKLGLVTGFDLGFRLDQKNV